MKTMNNTINNTMDAIMNNVSEPEALGPQQAWPITSTPQVTVVVAAVVSCLFALLSVQIYLSANKLLVSVPTVYCHSVHFFSLTEFG